MSKATRLLGRAYEIGRRDGLRALASATRWYLRYHVLPGSQPVHWRGRSKDRLEVECEDVSVTFDTTGRIAKEWFYPGQIDGRLHEPALVRRLVEALDRESVFYDVGANVGYFTVLASEVCIDGEVHSFELDSKFVEAIEASLRRNGTDAEIVQRAVSNESGRTVTYTDTTVPGITTGEGEEEGETKTVETITVDEYRESNPTPNVMKIDVEGFEYEVLQGARDTLGRPELKTLFLEVHPEKLRHFGHDKREILSLLDDAGFECKLLDDHRGSDSPVRRDADPDEIEGNTMLECHRESG